MCVCVCARLIAVVLLLPAWSTCPGRRAGTGQEESATHVRRRRTVRSRRGGESMITAQDWTRPAIDVIVVVVGLTLHCIVFLISVILSSDPIAFLQSPPYPPHPPPSSSAPIASSSLLLHCCCGGRIWILSSLLPCPRCYLPVRGCRSAFGAVCSLCRCWDKKSVFGVSGGTGESCCWELFRSFLVCWRDTVSIRGSCGRCWHLSFR